jgi:hypothetical protein
VSPSCWNHGDLGDTYDPGDIAIPSQIGEYRTVLQPIPVPSFPGMNVGGAIGCIPVLLYQNGTPDQRAAGNCSSSNVDGSLGFWIALEEEYGPVAQQRCWVTSARTDIFDDGPGLQ